MAGKRKVYTAEFKLSAVKMITEQKPAVAEVARRLGVTENRLHDGKKAIAKKGADASPGSGHLTPLEEENRKLKADVKRLQAERDTSRTRQSGVTGHSSRRSSIQAKITSSGWRRTPWLFLGCRAPSPDA